MTSKLFKICTLALVLLTFLAGGITACVQYPSYANGPGAYAKQGKWRHIKYGQRANPNPTATTDAVAASSSSFFQVMGGGNIWDSLRSDMKMPAYEDQAAVQSQIRWYMNHQDYLYHTISRAAPYIYYISQQVKQRNLPAELVLLPIMESEYNPYTTSSVGATGLWQLMPDTARGFGVRQDWWFDGRRDIYSSTNAALDYLTYLQSYFGGDWLLAMAAYDTGEGNVQSAIRRNAARDKSTSFWALPLSMETRSYVPRLLALAAIVKDPGKYGITLPTISNQPYLEQVDIGRTMSLAQAAKLADMPLPELKRLNAGYKSNAGDPKGPYKLLLPIDRIAMFKQQLAELPTAVKTKWGRYKVQRGDTLVSIADRYGTTVSDLKEVNRIHGRKVPTGKVIMIPTGTVEFSDKPRTELASNTNDSDVIKSSTGLVENNTDKLTGSETATDASESKAEKHSESHKASHAKAKHQIKKATYTVKSGDTLSIIAMRNGVSVNQIKHWNHLSGEHVKPGQKLKVG